MAVTSVQVWALEIMDGITYAVTADTLTMLEAADPHEPILKEMPRRPDWFVRTQIRSRPIGLGVYFLNPDATVRKTDYEALRDQLDNSLGLIRFRWTDSAVTKQLWVHCGSLVPDRWFYRANADLVAPDPTPEVI